MTTARIVVVEDDRLVASDIEQQLKLMGHQVVGMSSRGEDAVRLALEAQPDLVLMDIRLEGEVDGVEAAQQIREECRIPVIFLTAYADDETVMRASVTEPYGYILKPFEDSQLRTLVEMALYKHAAERRLEDIERRSAATLSSLADAVIATDNDGKIMFLNPVAEALTGYSFGYAEGMMLNDVYRLVDEETRMSEDRIATTLARGPQASVGVLIARNGKAFPIEASCSPITDDRGNLTGVVVLFRDVTQRRHGDEALRKARDDLARMSRLTVIGELSVSIAHEMNQPLMAIVTNAATCLHWVGSAPADLDRARQAAERIMREGHRAADILKSIRALAKNAPPAMSELDLNEAIRDVLVLTSGEMRRNGILIETDLSSSTPSVLGDRVQLQQVILNLVMNSVEAMSADNPGQKLLKIITESGDPGFAQVTVADTGSGLAPEIADRIFEAFFTTKAQGIGMGLSICRSIVEAHGGHIWVSPNQPHGSVFRFDVPVFAADGLK